MTSLPLVETTILAALVTTAASFLLRRESGKDQVAVIVLAYQIFMIVIFHLVQRKNRGHILLSRLVAIEANSRTILSYAMRYLLFYSVLCVVIMKSVILVTPYLAPMIAVEVSVMMTFGVAAFFFMATIGFNNYRSFIGQANMVLMVQVCWVVPVLLSTYFIASSYGAFGLTVGFMLVLIVQLVLHIIFNFKRLA